MTDGTSLGTKIVKDINPGASSSSPTILYNDGSGHIYFVANDGVHGKELWKSDGTDAGTVLVKDINPGPSDSNPTLMTTFQTKMLFQANDGTHGKEPWVTDGTTVGTVMLKDINAGAADSYPVVSWQDASFIYMSGADALHGQAFWRSDATSAGTEFLQDVNTAVMPGLFIPRPNELLYRVNVGDQMTFKTTDGTVAGTKLLDQSVLATSVFGMVSGFDGNVMYAIYDGTNTTVYKTDGTIAGTKDLSGPLPPSFYNFSAAGSTMYFGGSFGMSGPLYQSDGTTEGTTLIGTFDAFGYNGMYFGGETNDTFIFGHYDSTVGAKLEAVHNGTSEVIAGRTTTGGIPYKNPYNKLIMTNISGGLLYPGGNWSDPYQLWFTDGTASGTAKVMDIFPSGDPNIQEITAFGAGAVFSANDGVHGTEVWYSDGTAANTHLVVDLNPTGDAFPSSFMSDGAKFYFLASTPASGRELWVSDGTAAGTHLVIDMTPGSANSIIKPLAVANGELLFAKFEKIGAWTTWQTDGTVAGTRQMAELIGMPSYVGLVNDSLYLQVKCDLGACLNAYHLD